MSTKRPVDSLRRALLIYAGICGAAATAAMFLWRQQALGFALATAIGFVTALLVGQLCHRGVRRHVHELRKAADAITQGDLSRQIRTGRTEGFVKLADSLDRLADQLRTTVKQEQTLRRQLTRSETLALVGELAATVAHEVNNPLDGLQDAVAILRRHSALTGESQQLLELMDDGLYRIELIVQRLLAMSRDEPMQPEEVLLEEAVDDARMFAQPRFNRAGIEFSCEFPGDAPVVFADRRQLGQVLINLMLNAADAMPEGGTLVLTARENPDGDRLIIELTDNGYGIGPDEIGIIFEPFFTTKPGGKGTGLGLTVAKRIVDAHGGRISVASHPGEGTRFAIELPGTLRTSEMSEVGREIAAMDLRLL